VKQLSACLRFLRVVLHILGGVWTIRWQFPRLSQTQREERIQAWAQTMLARLAIDLVATGEPAHAGPVLMVSNHISWLDIVVIHATRHCRFISKADVQHWPLVGARAKGAGTLFIERVSRRDAMRVVHHMAESLRAGEVLAVFPEGTTGDGTRLLPFHANLLQAAISVNAPVQPLAIRFVDAASGQRSLAPCYIGEDTLLQSLWRILRTSGLQAQVIIGATEFPQGRDRRTWAAELQTQVQVLSGCDA
jgi:1-acyl-sn-glycerol-3-phosphate acyltransferase